MLGYPDSNQERQDQNLQCYHYTIPQTNNMNVCHPDKRTKKRKKEKLGYPDSNQERQDQNLQCYHYTIPQTIGLPEAPPREYGCKSRVSRASEQIFCHFFVVSKQYSSQSRYKRGLGRSVVMPFPTIYSADCSWLKAWRLSQSKRESGATATGRPAASSR